MALRTRLTWTFAAAGVVLAAVALALFQPWKLVVDDRVAEAVPVAAPAAPAVPAAPEAPAPPVEPIVLARGELISHEHESSGSVVVLELPDGSRVLRLEDLDTSNGPALKVWITDAPVIEGRDGWHVFDDGRYVDLGDLKGNIGSSNYALPRDVDLAQLPGVSVWCERFAVSFAAAALEPAVV
ncbi:DM13 domain-containing protein [Pseudonocardia sp. MH-G8]|uniref:DM13 domain-containing protein n=1 Tax=Pseudonocardia sp. MH-G8 TaxID=1854588 RepID=UPI000BA16ACF|nr:DM13 domain-containing protein [Pseudonocardia sp. MH-G8]OZM79223.1 electron transporter [Pseudonocardia sp. MH-G8]